MNDQESGEPCCSTLSRVASWSVRDYDLGATLESGQAFRWERVAARPPRRDHPLDQAGGAIAGEPRPALLGTMNLVGRGCCRNGAGSNAGWLGSSLASPGAGGSWEGIIGSRWVRLSQMGEVLHAETALPQASWDWIETYLQLDLDLDRVLATFPPDPPLLEAVTACRGLRLLRQDLWECLASFILSSTKQIVQIRQIIAALGERYGQPVTVPTETRPAWRFPTAHRLAACSEAELRACKTGFRAPYLLAVARQVAERQVDLDSLPRLTLPEARAVLMELPGVGRKIADCVLLFAGGFPRAFPVDVWVLRALRELYPQRRRLTSRQVLAFCEAHFGPHGGYAQQYLFHYRRVHGQPPRRRAH